MLNTYTQLMLIAFTNPFTKIIGMLKTIIIIVIALAIIYLVLKILRPVLRKRKMRKMERRLRDVEMTQEIQQDMIESTRRRSKLDRLDRF